MVTPCFESMGEYYFGRILIQNIAEIQSVDALICKFYFQEWAIFVSVLSHTLTALKSLFEEMSKIIL